MSEVDVTPSQDDHSLLLILPYTALRLVLQNCSAQDLSALNQTCSYLRDLTFNENLWKSLCKFDYGVTDLEINSLGYYEIYSSLLHKHGWMLGLYHCKSEPYGGLLEVRYWKGAIQGNMCIANCHPPESLLQRTAMFSLVPTNLHPRCLLDESSTHTAEICRKDDGKFIYKSPNTYIQQQNDYIADSKMHQCGPDGITYEPFSIQNIECIPSELKMGNGMPSPQIITPGLFTGLYGSHGIEVIYFSVKEENIIQGTKVTGDPNVFSGKVSVKFDIQHSLRPSLSEQRSFETLSTMTPEVSPTPNQFTPSQMFVLPHDSYINEKDIIDLPEECHARYHGHIQIAEVGFQNPSMTPAQVVIFNDNLIGIMWIGIKYMKFLHRIMEFAGNQKI